VGGAHQIFGTPDDLKLRSCMTLFELAAAAPAPVFAQVLDLVRQRATVVIAQRLNDVPCRAFGVGAQHGTRQLSQVGVGNAVEFRLELHRAQRRTPERIERNRQMTKFLDRGEQFRGTGGFAEKGRVGRAAVLVPPAICSATRKNWRQDSSTEAGSRRYDSYTPAM
jgi:hypothetical protein